MSGVSIFSGCNLVQTDLNKYYDRIVAKAVTETGTSIEVTKRELLNYYSSALSNSYGYVYNVEDVLEEVINRKLLVEEVKSNFQVYVEGIGEVYLEDSTDEILLKRIENKYYYNEAMQKAYDYVDEQILNYENSLRSARGEELIKDDEDETTDYKPEELYEKSVKRNELGVFEIKKEDIDIEDTIKAPYDYTTIDHGDLTLRTKAYKMFANALLRSEKGKGLSNNQEDAINREIDRVYKIYEEQTYLDFFQKKYEYNYTISNENVVRKYQELVKSSYSEWLLEGGEDSEDAYTKYIERMNSGASSVYYHPYVNKTNSEGNRQGFIQVAHILIKFDTDTQLIGVDDDNITSWKEIYDQKDQHGDDDSWYNTQLEQWKSTCKAKARYTLEDEKLDPSHKAGNEYGEAKTYDEIFNEITQALGEADSVQEKAEIINKYAYKYSQDVDKNNKVNMSSYYAVSLDPTASDSWAGDFAKTCRDVYFGNAGGNVLAQGEGGYSGAYLLTNVIDKDGNYTFNKDSSYAGMDMVFVLGEYNNLYDITQIDDLTKNDASINLCANKLYDTRVMLGVDKSWYDMLYDSVTLLDYSTERQNAIDTLRDNLEEIIYYKDAYKDLMN